MNDNNDLLGQRLLARHHVTEDDINRACELQSSLGGRIGSSLIKLGAVSEDYLLEALSEQLEMPVLEDRDIPEVSELFKFMSQLQINFDWFLAEDVVVWPEAEHIWCIARDVLNPEIGETLRHFLKGKAVRFGLATSYTLERILDDLKREHSVDNLFQQSEDARQLRELAEEAPVVEFVNNMMARAVDVDASDIHIEPEEQEFKVR
ncbi:MAG: type II secretion system protein, partial [Proteobacteria bacterium]|nr:type II secretion system protein [Pseudomonadota bacterium]